MVKPKTYMDQFMNLSLPLADVTDEFISGEFIHWNADGEAVKMHEVDPMDNAVCRCVFHNTSGRSDRLGTNKVTILDGEYLAEIDVYDDSSGDYGNGDWLAVADLSIVRDGVTYTGGFLTPGEAGETIWAQCIVPPGGLERGPLFMLVKLLSPFVL